MTRIVFRQVREGVFETNSSSTHSVTRVGNIDSKYEGFEIDPDDRYVHVNLRDFGWEREEYVAPLTKLQYYLAMVVDRWWDRIDKEFYDNNDIDFRRKFIKDKTKEFFESNEEWLELDELIRQELHCAGLWIEDGLFTEKCYGNIINTYWDLNGTIDHQSTEDFNCGKDFLDFYGVTLEEFIFDRSVILITDNDNRY